MNNMAGPVASVLVFESELFAPTWREVMDDVADDWGDATSCWVSDTKKVGGTYAGEGRPFVGSIERISAAMEYSMEALRAVTSAIRREPTHHIGVAAMCNGRVDHRVLCEIVRYLCAARDGIVDFDGDVVSVDIEHPGLSRCNWLEEGSEYRTQLGTVEFCDWWLRQPDFHMVK
jgi:hypothetical protein